MQIIGIVLIIIGIIFGVFSFSSLGFEVIPSVYGYVIELIIILGLLLAGVILLVL